MHYRNGLDVRSGTDFHKDMDRLIAYLKQRFPGLSELQPESEQQSKPAPRERRQVVPSTPADMVKVPTGPFLYGDDNTRTVINYDYWIDKYPVTNQKYRAFIQAGGYDHQQYWSPEGWKWKTEKKITSPEYWDATWNKPDHPVVHVSYYEAQAYAKWAGKRLPTEQEWEKAARGKDGRKYPWGEEFDENKCNGDGSGIGHTTPVTQYPNGVSLYDCYDMAGNVWEWCADWYNKEVGQRVARGGSFYNPPEILRGSNRDGYRTVGRYNFLGFRLVQDIEE